MSGAVLPWVGSYLARGVLSDDRHLAMSAAALPRGARALRVVQYNVERLKQPEAVASSLARLGPIDVLTLNEVRACCGAVPLPQPPVSLLARARDERHRPETRGAFSRAPPRPPRERERRSGGSRALSVTPRRCRRSSCRARRRRQVDLSGPPKNANSPGTLADVVGGALGLPHVRFFGHVRGVYGNAVLARWPFEATTAADAEAAPGGTTSGGTTALDRDVRLRGGSEVRGSSCGQRRRAVVAARRARRVDVFARRLTTMPPRRRPAT